MMSLDKDEHMLALLRQNARFPVSELARRLGVSRTAAQARLDKLERNGVINGYTVRLSSRAQADRVRALVMIKSPPSNRRAIEKELSNVASLTTLYSISGEFDLAAEISAGSVEELDRVIDSIGTLEGVSETQSSVILSTKIER